MYDTPVDLLFAHGLGKAGTTIHLSEYDDETSRACAWHVPKAHLLESWSDTRAFDGTIGVVQPLIAPLYGGKSEIELLAMMAGDELTGGYDIVRRTLEPMLGDSSFEASWRQALHGGLVVDTAWPVETPRLRRNEWETVAAEMAGQSMPADDACEIVFCCDYSVYDGRFANNAWLQELPDPMTKMTWGNAAIIGPAYARTLGVDRGDRMTLAFGRQKLTLPVYVMPGMAEGTIALPLGYGRLAGAVAKGVGWNAYALRTSGAMDLALGATVAGVVKVERRKWPAEVVTTQDHHPVGKVGEDETAKRVPMLVREADLDYYREHPDFARHMVHQPESGQLFASYEYNGHRWGMAIDLSKCTGCSACVVACQAENNIPVVGKEQVARGREMHWIRVDRYFKGAAATADAVHQPIPCMHCEDAPCEEVCPVAATVHDGEGLNVMVYNRCVGTRYCSNNCPYKVRRFNFFNYRKDMEPVAKMAMNPEVTVRSRGVMEKCSYCVQRIRAAKVSAKNQRLPVLDGQITPACAQVCSSDAIVFGDLNDQTSRVAKLLAGSRAYAMLGDLNVKPRTQYLARVNNPNPVLAAGGGAGHGEKANEHGHS